MPDAVDYQSLTSLPQMFFTQANKQARSPFLWAKDKTTDKYASLSWQDVRQQVCQLANGLLASGVGAGDRVVIVSENRPEWLIADIAIMAIGAISVPAYTTNKKDDHLYVYNNCAAKAVILSTELLAKEAVAAAESAPSVEFVVTMAPSVKSGTVRIITWDDMLQKGAAYPQDKVEKLAENLDRKETSCIIYTSGTGGAPKGVMLSHGAIISNCEGAGHCIQDIGLGHEVFLSFLPLSHSYEHSAGQFFPISIGAEIYYAESIEALGQNFIEACPTIMVAVPRLYEVFHNKIQFGMRKASSTKKKFFADAVRLGTKNFIGEHLTLREKIYNAFLDLTVRRKVKKRFGGRLKALVSGGAPLNYEIGMFFTALGLNLLQGYGQTEAAPVVSCNNCRTKKIETVGAPLKGVDVKIANDGEILVAGELLMNGYWGEAELTAQTIKDGWLHTGDIGLIDEDGQIKITDRKKDIIVNAGGDNISPARVEGFLTLQPEIHQAMVYGDKRPHLVALIVPDETFTQQWASRTGKTAGQAATDAEFRSLILAAVERVNQRLSVIEKVRTFVLTNEPFSVDNNQMTPTLKIKRHRIKEQYGEDLDALYTRGMRKTG